jgi:hypothetical protein
LNASSQAGGEDDAGTGHPSAEPLHDMTERERPAQPRGVTGVAARVGESIIVVVALPEIGHDLGFPDQMLRAVTSACAVASAAFLLIARALWGPAGRLSFPPRCRSSTPPSAEGREGNRALVIWGAVALIPAERDIRPRHKPLHLPTVAA